jgi:hypothetical protein
MEMLNAHLRPIGLTFLAAGYPYSIRQESEWFRMTDLRNDEMRAKRQEGLSASAFHLSGRLEPFRDRIFWLLHP